VKKKIQLKVTPRQINNRNHNQKHLQVTYRAKMSLSNFNIEEPNLMCLEMVKIKVGKNIKLNLFRMMPRDPRT
jgi:hypothetical protein